MPRNCWIIALAWLVISGCADTLSASAPRYTVDAWDADAGLPQSSVIALTQSRDGYLWLGTMDGLVRFDGLRFKIYNEANTPGLPRSPIVKLFEDSQTNLWIGTETAGVFLARNGRVTAIDIGRGTREGRLMSICEDHSGSVWLYTADGQLARYRDGRVEVGRVGPDYPSQCRSVIADGTGTIWVGTDWRLYGLRPERGASNGLPHFAYEAIVPKLDFLLPSREGEFWCLVNRRIQKWTASGLKRDLGSYPWDPAVTPVNAACEDSQGNLIVGTGGEGIFWFDVRGHSAQLTTTNTGLSHNTILSLCMDREGNLWAGTDGGGLDRVKNQIFDVLPESKGLVVKSVWPDRERGLWVGYNAERIDYLKASTHRQFGPEQGLLDLNVRAVLQCTDQTVWAATFGRGLLLLQKGLFLPAPGSEFIPRDKEVSALFEDRQHRLWVGSEVGLACWDGRVWTQWMTNRNGSAANKIRAIAEDREGGIWVGTEGGLDRLLQGSVATFTRTNGLPSDDVTSLLVDSSNVVWVGTSSGLARFENGKWTSYENRIGLGYGNVGFLLVDNEDFLWIGSSSGLMRVPKKALNDIAAGAEVQVAVRAYGKADGLPTRECSVGSQPAACADSDGTLWFPTIKGLAFVHPNLIHRNTNPPPVVIESVLVGGVYQSSNSLRAPVPVLVTIPPGKQGLEIDFAGLNLSAPDKGLFRYRLEKHETEWTEVPGTVRSVRYSKLPPGDYRFQVQACNEDGVWNEQGRVLEVVVLPPFYRTWPFITAVTLCLLGIIIGSVHYVSTQRLQRQLAAMRQQEALEKERARIARDLHDQLGANLTQVALLGEMAETDKALPEEVESHARQISQTARDTTRALDEIVWTVNPSNDTLDGLINYVCKYAQEYLALAGLRYRLEVPSELAATPITPELRHNVFLAAKEAVNNVVKHSKATSAWVRLHLDPDRFVLEIEDNGRGLRSGDADKGRNGLRNMRRRLEDIGGQFEVSPGAEGGTRVRLIVPVRRPSAGG